MKKRIYLCLLILLCSFGGYAQNPFIEYGYDVKIATLTQGEFNESHDENSIVEIGSVIFDVKKGKIVGEVADSIAVDKPQNFKIEIVSRFVSIDPHSERYYSISPYAYCNNNPILNTDPTGMDYWSTNDPEEIRAFCDAWNGMRTSLGLQFFHFSSWNHVTDEQFVGDLSFNDETGIFYSSFGMVEEGSGVVIYGISIKAMIVSYEDGSATIKTNQIATGALNNVYPEFGLLTLGRGLSNWSSIPENYNNSQKLYFSEQNYKGKYFRGGKIKSRDGLLSDMPKQFQRWIHHYYKDFGPNIPNKELKSLYKEWIRMGSPKVK